MVQVRDRSTGFRGAHRPGVSDLGAERDVELATRGVERVVAAVVGRQAPQPWQHPQRPEPVHLDARRSSTTAAIGRIRSTEATPDEAVRVCDAQFATSSLVIIGPDGPHQAHISPRPTPALSIISKVVVIGWAVSENGPGFQRRSDEEVVPGSVEVRW